MNILFMCVANSARSQLAEAIAKQVLGDQVSVYSAGSQPSTVNPFAVRALQEWQIDTQSLYSKTVADLPPALATTLDYVITLCAEEVCPVVLSGAKKLHWPLPDPAGQKGDDDAQLTRFRATRDEIKRRLQEFKTGIPSLA